MRLAIGLVDIPAARTSTRRVARINNQYGHTEKPGFVLDKLTQLVKGPTVEIVSLCAPEPYPTADAGKVFQTNAAVGALRVVYDLFTDAVIHVRGKALFFAGKSLKALTGRRRLLGLYSSALAATALAQGENLRTAINVAVRIGRDVDDAAINTQPHFGIKALRFGDVAGLVNVVLTIAQNQIGFALHTLQQLKLALPGQECHFLATVNRPDGDRLFVELPTEDAVVVGDRTQRGKPALSLLVQLVGVCDLGDGTYRHLCRQAKLFADQIVGGMVQIVLPKLLGHPRDTTDFVSGFVGRHKGLSQRFGLLFARLQLDLRNQFHAYSIAHFFKYRKPADARILISSLAAAVFPPTTQVGGIQTEVYNELYF